jgi:hypothetical protein
VVREGDPEGERHQPADAVERDPDLRQLQEHEDLARPLASHRAELKRQADRRAREEDEAPSR